MVQFVLLVLLAFSVVSWAIIFLKYRLIGRAQTQSEGFLQAFWSNKNLDSLYEISSGLLESPLAKVFRAGYREFSRVNQAVSGESQENSIAVATEPSGVDNIRRALVRARSLESNRLERSLIFLATTGSTAPFVGLFGTVWGIMNAFRGIGRTGAASLAVVAPGISEALIATAAGLAAAIPAVVAYNYYVNRTRALEEEMENFSSEFLNLVERHYLRR
jgi:biopolymer transport protein TolQ